MHTAALLLALSLSAHAIPVFQARGNDTLDRRDEPPYKVVDVAGPDTPAVQTVTITNPAGSPTTVTITESPSATPSSSGLPFERREANDSSKAFRRFGTIADAASNGTEARSIVARSNDTEIVSRAALSETKDSIWSRSNSTADIVARAALNETKDSILPRSNSTADVVARSNDTANALSARGSSSHNETKSGIHARGNTTEVFARGKSTEVFARGSHNETAHENPARGNDTIPNAPARRAYEEDAALTDESKHANSTESKAALASRSNSTEQARGTFKEDAALIDENKHANATKRATNSIGDRSLSSNETV
ncbi:hypothetical protein BO71DRAFT_72347 [Aspergillus ellipticus CBS 707.79]|uniref:Uncharacterized protein n=1 Tax=Aspergillus ellipticus CBS 707.79 TaxID=1448320 RepID=A0A319CZ62_9EURO|nr:hypothetical protein BO71DRAFT_72347 [Aspergillus ellipticus CBS 707.79]